jgi:hypothetical protein
LALLDAKADELEAGSFTAPRRLAPRHKKTQATNGYGFCCQCGLNVSDEKNRENGQVGMGCNFCNPVPSRAMGDSV